MTRYHPSDPLYSANQASTNPVVQRPSVGLAPLSPFNSGGDPRRGALDDSYVKYQQQQFPEQQLGQYQSSLFGPDLGKTLGDLSALNSNSGLSSLMGPQPLGGTLTTLGERPPSPLSYEEPFTTPQQNPHLIKPVPNTGGNAPSAFDPLGVGGRDQEILGDIRDPGLTPTRLLTAFPDGVTFGPPPEGRPVGGPPPMPSATMPQPVQPTMPTPTMPQPVQPTMPSATPMPGDVGYVPYGSSNNQLVPPGYEKPSFVQGLAGGGPVGNLSFVELLRQTMEN